MSANYPESWGTDESRLWEEIAENRTGEFNELLSDDRTAATLFNEGWITDDPSGNRMLFRDAFFDYCIEEGYLDDPGEFDWEAWREYMGY